jgi:hypothetical protein
MLKYKEMLKENKNSFLEKDLKIQLLLEKIEFTKKQLEDREKQLECYKTLAHTLYQLVEQEKYKNEEEIKTNFISDFEKKKKKKEKEKEFKEICFF